MPQHYTVLCSYGQHCRYACTVSSISLVHSYHPGEGIMSHNFPASSLREGVMAHYHPLLRYKWDIYVICFATVDGLTLSRGL